MSQYSINKRFAIACLLSIFGLTFISSAQGQGFRVTEVFLKADDAQMIGPCPLKVVFNGYITANGPGTVKYTFGRSDGARGPAYAIEFREAGTQTVSTTWTLGNASLLPRFRGWQSLKILFPYEMESSQKTGSFSVACSQPRPPQPMIDGAGNGPGSTAVPSSARFRVTVTGFVVSNATTENVLSPDGAGDEVFALVNFAELSSSNSIIGPVQKRQSLIYGDTSGYPYPFGVGRILGEQPTVLKAGHASPTGGLMNPDRVGLGGELPDIPRNLNRENRARVIPMVLWEGELRSGPQANAVVLLPTIWENDNVSDVLYDWHDQAGTFIRRFARSSSRYITGTTPRPLVEQLETVLRTIPQRNDFDRPIGMDGNAFDPWSADPDPATFNPAVMLLTFNSAQAAANSTTQGRGIVEITYRDGDRYGRGIYTMFLRVDRLPDY